MRHSVGTKTGLPQHAVLLLTIVFSTAAVQAEEIALPVGRSFAVSDSINQTHDENDDANVCLDGLCWAPQKFTVECMAAERAGVDALLRFPSARPIGMDQNDRVAVEWYAAMKDGKRLERAPAMVVVHESGRGMTVGRLISRGLQSRGIHCFMVQLPFYGLRRPSGVSVNDQSFAAVMSQGISDVRRTRDAVAALPMVDKSSIGLQGTSLGGFVSSTVAGLDNAFDSVFVLLAGGDLPRLVLTGERETAQLRKRLEGQGFTGERLFNLLNRFEPNRLAHRIPAEKLWLFTATFDTTVPPDHAYSFATAAGLDESRHIRMPATHYSGIIFLPMILDRIAQNAGGRAVLNTNGSQK